MAQGHLSNGSVSRRHQPCQERRHLSGLKRGRSGDEHPGGVVQKLGKSRQALKLGVCADGRDHHLHEGRRDWIVLAKQLRLSLQDPLKGDAGCVRTSEATAALRRREFDFLPFSVFGTLTGTRVNAQGLKGRLEAPLPG